MLSKKSPKLAYDQVIKFYDIFLAILEFINKKHNLVKKLVGKNFREGVLPKDISKIADYLWEHPDEFDDYIRQFKPESGDLTLIRSWKTGHIKGKFYIVKYLKEGAVFIAGGNDDNVYIVKGLVNSYDEICGSSNLPIPVNTVLLPFEDVIITSGIIYTLSIVFGSHFRAELLDMYREAKINNTLIKSIK